jgi:hypothetical protein
LLRGFFYFRESGLCLSNVVLLLQVPTLGCLAFMLE